MALFDSQGRMTRLPNQSTIVTTTQLPVPQDVARRYPYRWQQTIARRFFIFQLDWNDYAHFWLLQIENDDEILARRKLTYGIDALHGLHWIPEFRALHIVPFDRRLKWMHIGLTLDNLGTDVSLYYALENPSRRPPTKQR